MPASALDRHTFAIGFTALAVAVSLLIGLLPARQATDDFETPQLLVALFAPGEPAHASRDAIREAGALPRRALLDGMLVSFVAWNPQQVQRLERDGAFVLALPSRLDFALGCTVIAPQ